MSKRSELTDLFEKYGAIEKCDVLRNFAFVVSFVEMQLTDSEMLSRHGHGIANSTYVLIEMKFD